MRPPVHFHPTAAASRCSKPGCDLAKLAFSRMSRHSLTDAAVPIPKLRALITVASSPPGTMRIGLAFELEMTSIQFCGLSSMW